MRIFWTFKDRSIIYSGGVPSLAALIEPKLLSAIIVINIKIIKIDPEEIKSIFLSTDEYLEGYILMDCLMLENKTNVEFEIY